MPDYAMLETLRENPPLVHYIAGPISVRDAANALLALGARPIMAEHLNEVTGIASGADALALNLSGITDDRARAMQAAGSAAKKAGVPAVLDLVGISCSKLRLAVAKNLLKHTKPAVVKGNASEFLALQRDTLTAPGVDATKEALEMAPGQIARQARELAANLGCVVAVSGPVDVVAGAQEAALVCNGTSMLGSITATGCMLTALVAAYAGAGLPVFEAALLGCVTEGVAGELAAADAKGPGSFSAAFFDALYNLDAKNLRENARVERLANP